MADKDARIESQNTKIIELVEENIKAENQTANALLRIGDIINAKIDK